MYLPEQQLVAASQEVLDKGILTRAADVYSFALIIWSLVAGEVRGFFGEGGFGEVSCYDCMSSCGVVQMQTSKRRTCVQQDVMLS